MQYFCFAVRIMNRLLPWRCDEVSHFAVGRAVRRLFVRQSDTGRRTKTLNSEKNRDGFFLICDVRSSDSEVLDH